MKTFEEALQLNFSQPASHESQEQLALRMCAEVQRFNSITTEIANSDSAQAMVDTYLEVIATGRLDVSTALMSLFISGVVVGMEMERQQLPTSV